MKFAVTIDGSAQVSDRRILARAIICASVLACALPRAAASAAGPVARWTFEEGESAVELKKGASVLTFGAHGKCLRLADGSSRAVARTDAKTPDIADAAKPYTVMLWLKPDGGLVDDNLVEMAKMAGRRATKFMSAMNDGKWHHLAVAHDPARKGREYTLWLDWGEKSSPWRFTSDYDKNEGVAKCVLPFALKRRRATFGGNAGVGMFTVGYRGLVDDMVVFDHALTSDELAQFLISAAAAQ